MRTLSPLPWFGSDSEVAAELAAMLDHCKHVTIPFCGGLAILPHLRARAIVANDLHEHAINFYRAASGLYGEDIQEALFHRCRNTLSHPSDLARAIGGLKTDSILLSAWGFWALCWLGRKGKGGTKSHGGMPSIRRTASGGTNASRIRAAADDLAEWAEQFRRCEWECRDFRDVLDSVADRHDCGAYCDPPWRGAGDGYRHSFTEQDHRDLRELLGRFEKTTVVVRYGDDRLIRELYADWTIIERSSRTQANRDVGELWIVNFFPKEN